MSESRCRKRVNISWRLLILLALSLSGCGIDSKYVFIYSFPISGLPIAGFPIIGVYTGLNMGVEYISGSLRVLCSIVVYAILFSLLATLLLYIKKSFENKVLFQYYILYWLVASLIFANLFLLLIGYVPDMNHYYNKVLRVSLDILLPTLLPAFYQYFRKRIID